MINTTVVFFDTETNGYPPCSVLSIAAFKAHFTDESGLLTFQEEGAFERYYFRTEGEAVCASAINVNGLTDEVIKQKRAGAGYPLHFAEDNAFQDFCGAARFAAHNIQFDEKFLPFSIPAVKFCTMKENSHIVNLRRKDGSIKWPSLSETAHFYGIRTDTASLHGASYDARLVYEIFIRMLDNKKASKKVMKFLGKA